MKITEVAEGRFVESVTEDEMSWSFYEGHFLNPSGSEWRRYRVEYVYRDVPDSIHGRMFAFVTDLGPQSLDTYPALHLISAGTDTIGEMRQLAFLARSDHAPELPELNDNFGQEAQDNLAHKREQFLGRTLFGYGKTAPVEQRDRT